MGQNRRYGAGNQFAESYIGTNSTDAQAAGNKEENTLVDIFYSTYRTNFNTRQEQQIWQYHESICSRNFMPWVGNQISK